MRKTLLYKLLFSLVRCMGRVINYAIPVSYRELKEVTNDHRWDKKLGIETGWFPLLGSKKLGSAAGANKDGTRYEAATYSRLLALADVLKPSEQDVFVDLGCGKGRVVFVMSTCKVKKSIGVEFDEALANDAKRNLKNMRVPHAPVEIIQGDAADFDSSEITILYMYNPFGPKTMEQVLLNLKNGWLARPRQIRIYYCNPLCRDLVSAQDWLKFEGICPATGAAVWKTV